jgi:hypothetical protein
MCYILPHVLLRRPHTTPLLLLLPPLRSGLNALSKISTTSAIICSKPWDLLVCLVCQLGQHTRLPFHQSSSCATQYFDLIHYDLWISPIVSISGSKYYPIILYDFHTILRLFLCIWSVRLFRLSPGSSLLSVLSSVARSRVSSATMGVSLTTPPHNSSSLPMATNSRCPAHTPFLKTVKSNACCALPTTSSALYSFKPPSHRSIG